MEELDLKFDLSSENEGQPTDKTLKFEEEDKKQETPNEGQLDKEKEEPKEEPAEPIKQEPEVDINTDSNSNIKEFVKSVLGETTLELVDEEGNIEEKSIDEANLTEQEWGDLIKNHYSDKISTLKEGSVQLSGLDEVRKAMISAIKSGKNPKEVLHFQENYVDPMSDLDISDEEGQKEVLGLRYKDAIERGDMSKSDLNTIVEAAKSKGELEEKAEEAFEQIKNALKSKAEEIEENARQEEKERKEFYKDYEKNFKNLAKETLGVEGKYAKELVDFVLKPDKDEPRLTQFNAKVMEMLKQPEKAVDLVLYVYDTEKFNNKVSSKTKMQVLEDQKKKVRVVKKYKQNKGLPDKKDKEDSDNKVLFSTNIK